MRAGRIHLLISAFVLAIPAATAQDTMTSMAKELDRAGFGFYDVSVFGGYTSTQTPTIDSSGNFIPDYSFHSVMTGVAASIGWRLPKSDNVHFVIRYSPSYYYQSSSTGFSASRFTPTQNLQLSWSKALAAKWSVGASLSVAEAQYNQLLLLSDPNQILAGSPGTAGELAGAILTGSGTNANLNATATGANAIIAGQQNLLYGNRIFTGAASTNVTYAFSERLSLSASVGLSRTQHLPDGSGTQTPYLMHQSTAISATFGTNYRLSERTNFFATVGYAKGISSLYQTPTANIFFGLGRTLTPHVFAHAGVGAGYVLPSAQGQFTTSFHKLNWQASAGLGYRFLRQSLVGNISRMVSDTYGLGAANTTVGSVGWSWHPLASAWGISAAGAGQRLDQTPFGRDGYRVMIGVNRSLGDRVFMNLSYGYGYGSSVLLSSPNTLTSPYTSKANTIRLSIGWRPYLGSPDPTPLPFPGQVNPIP